MEPVVLAIDNYGLDFRHSKKANSTFADCHAGTKAYMEVPNDSIYNWTAAREE